MSEKIEDKQKKISSTKQNNFAPIILWLFPLLLINLGWYFLETIDYYWNEQEQTENANQKIELFAAKSDFSYCLSSMTGQFSDLLKSDAELFGGKSQQNLLTTYVKNRIDFLFRPPFPKHDIFILKINNSSDKSEIIYRNNETSANETSICSVFEYLVKASSNNNSIEEPDEAKKILGINNNLSLFANKQRAKVLFSKYNNKTNWFVWDYFSIEPTNDIFGYLIFVENNQMVNEFGRKLAIKEINTEKATKQKEELVAFIPLFPDNGGIIASEELIKKEKLYENIKNLIPKDIKELEKWHKDDYNFKLDKIKEFGYKTFFNIAPNQTHAAILLMPVFYRTLPFWLIIINIIALTIIAFLLLRGFLFGIWPQKTLRKRFITNYFLAACLPLGLLVIASYGYISEYKHTAIFENQTKLKICISEFDKHKSQKQNEYKRVATEVQKESNIIDLLSIIGNNLNQPLKDLPNEALHITNEILNKFNKDNNNLPIIAFTLTNNNGYGFGNLGNEFSPFFVQPEGENNINNKIKNIEDYKNLRQNITVNSQEYIFNIYWDEKSLDEKTFVSSITHFGINEPNLIFAAYKVDTQGIKPWPIGFDRYKEEFINSSTNLIKQAFFRKSSVSSRNENMSMVAVPSSKYEDVIFVGAVYFHDLNMDVFKRFWICILVIIIAFIIFSCCLHYSSIVFIKPISKLKNMLDKISEGNLNIKIKSNSKDEFGIMAKEFNEMTKELSKRNNLATLISDHAIEALNNKDKNSNGLDVETFKGTVLVSDIRNFTGLSEENLPEQMTELLNNHFAKMTKIISSNGGRIYKYIGDAIEAIFAEDDDLEKSSAERAFITSIQMLNCLKEINVYRKEKGLFEYKIGIGLSYGNMTSGTIGNLETRLDYAIIGDVLKNAEKLENLSKNTPELPLIIDKNLTEIIAQRNPNVKFYSLDNENLGFKTDQNSIELFSDKVKTDKFEIDSNAYISNNNTDEEKNDSLTLFEIEEEFSFYRKFIPGSIFIVILAIIMTLGVYFVFTTANNNEKISLSITNNRVLEQILSDDSGKTIFDIKARIIAANIQNKIDKLNEKEINDEFITDCLNKSISEDKSLEGIKVNRVFVKIDQIPEINSKDNTFIDKISLHPIANVGYSEEELNNICNSFKLCIGLNLLNKISQKLYLSHSDSLNFEQASKEYMKEKYGEPSRNIFGETIDIKTFNEKLINNTNEVIYNKESNLIFYIDFFKEEEEKSIGYLLISIPTEQVKSSISMLMSAYSLDESLVSLKNKESGEWYFSNNISEDMKKGILLADEQEKTSQEKPILERGNSYLYNVLGVTSRGIKYISGVPYDLYSTQLCSLNKGNPLNSLFCVFIVIIGIGLLLWRISKGISIINTSIAKKLWVALLTVAVIPIITVFFVFGLFRSEYYSVKTSFQKSEMQHYSSLFENKDNFYSPLIWNYLINKNNSSELLNNAKILNDINIAEESKQEKLKNIKQLVQNWINEPKSWNSYDYSFVNFSIKNVYIFGKNNWNLFFDGNKDKTENDLFLMLQELSNNILKNNLYSGLNENSSEDSFKYLNYIRKTYGNVVYLQILNGLNYPIYLDNQNGKTGLIISKITNDNNTEMIIVWEVDFLSHSYLEELSKNIKSNYIINFLDKHKLGGITPNNNHWRLLLGKFATWINISNLPISNYVKTFNNKRFFVEGKSSVKNNNSIIILGLFEDALIKEINLITLTFYILLGISMLIIIRTTMNISDDMISPIKCIMDGIKEVNKENFSYQINSDRTDELGALCSSFDKMVRGLEEKRLISRMLSNTARTITLKEGKAIIGNSETILLYIGVPGFSEYNKNLRDKELFNKLREQTSLIAKIIMEEGGEIDKIVGDKLLAVFSVNEDESMIAKKACMAAKRLIEMENSNSLPLPISIAINYGNVINGFLGIGNKRDFTVIGDPVNTTARIEKLSEKLTNNRCLISESFYKLIDSSFKADKFGEVELKGKTQTINVYQLS